MAIVLLADVMPWIVWQMLLTPLCYCSVCDRWKATVVGVMVTCIEQKAGVISNVADEIAT